MELKEIYEKSLVNAENRFIESSNLATKPIMISDIISPESTISIQPFFQIEFELDKEGMYKIIEMLEDRWANKDNAKNLMMILTDIYSVTEEYLGGHGIPQKRQNAYIQADNNRLKLSEIENANIGLCAERSAMAHQLLVLLNQAGVIKYESFLTNSHLTTDTKEPHSFVILKHKEDESKKFIYDIENPVRYKKTPESQPVWGVGLYAMTEEEYKDFIAGNSITPKSIYEQFGMSIVDEKRTYGDQDSKEIER